MQQYLYNYPQIMTDSLFTLYGGQTGTSTEAQREIAYTLAEEQMVEYLGSYLTPTLVSGTHLWRGNKPVELDYGWITQIHSISFGSFDGRNSCSLTNVTGCYIVRNAQYGYLDVGALANCNGCGSILGLAPYQVYVSYESGLSTGAYTSKAMIQALTIASQINLNEIDVSLSNETIADIGIEFFINQRYHEKRLKGITTAFGNSALAQRVARLVRKYRARPGTAVY